MRITTPPKYGYSTAWVSVTGRRNFGMVVKACQDVYLALSHIPSNPRTLTYEIVIGGQRNTITAIRTSMNATSYAKQSSTPQILDCNTAKVFWLTWNKGTIKVGKGPDDSEYI